MIHIHDITGVTIRIMAAAVIEMDATGVMDVTAAGGAMAVMPVMDATLAGAAMVDVYRYRHRELKVEVEKVVTVLWLTISRGPALLAYRARALAGNRDVQ